MNATRRIPAQNEIQVTDLHLGAYLMAHGFPLVRVEGSGARKAFVFKEVPDSVVMAFYAGTDRSSARTLYAALRDLKGLALQVL